MRTIYYSCILLLISACIQSPQPKLFIDKYEIDLGTISSSDKKNGKILLKNMGNDTLHILYIGSSCGCTTVDVPKNFLLPGESDMIGFELDASGLSGRVERDINILTNDSAKQSVEVKIIAEVVDILRPVSESNVLYIVEIVKKQNPVTKRMAMINISNGPVSILGDSVSSKSITAKFDKRILQPGDTLNIEVTVLPEHPGIAEETMQIITDHKIQPNAEIKIVFFGTQEN